jgi:hypothetical protein
MLKHATNTASKLSSMTSQCLIIGWLASRRGAQSAATTKEGGSWHCDQSASTTEMQCWSSTMLRARPVCKQFDELEALL